MTAPETSPAPQKRLPRWLRWGLEGLAMVAVALAIHLWQTRDTPRGPAPDFSGVLSDGRATSLAQWRAQAPGKPLLVYFWADWCAICKATRPSVEAIAADWPVLTVAMDSGPPPQVARTLAERGYRFPALADPDGRISNRYGLPGVPAFVIIDPRGNIQAVSIGYTSEWSLRWRLWRAASAA